MSLTVEGKILQTHQAAAGMLPNLLGSPSESTNVSRESSQNPRSAKYLHIEVSKLSQTQAVLRERSHNNVLKTTTAIKTKNPRANNASLLLFMLRYMTSIVLKDIGGQDYNQRYNRMVQTEV